MATTETIAEQVRYSQSPVVTHDGIAVRVDRSGRGWQVMLDEIRSVTSAHEITVLDKPGMWWYSANTPWVPRSLPPLPARIASKEEPDDAEIVAAVELVAETERRANAIASARRAIRQRTTDVLTSARDHADNMRGTDRDIHAHNRLFDLANRAAAQGWLSVEEIVEITGLRSSRHMFADTVYETGTGQYKLEPLVPGLYYGIAQVAIRLGVGESTVRRYRSEGRLPGEDIMLGTSPAWELDTIEDWHTARPGKGGRPRKDASE